MGFHYDLEDYEEALLVFRHMQEIAQGTDSREYHAMALIWQGHMLDLLERRQEAIALYQLAVEMNVNESWQHSQFGMEYVLSPYAAERIKEPFRRIENRQR